MFSIHTHKLNENSNLKAKEDMGFSLTVKNLQNNLNTKRNRMKEKLPLGNVTRQILVLYFITSYQGLMLAGKDGTPHTKAEAIPLPYHHRERKI